MMGETTTLDSETKEVKLLSWDRSATSGETPGRRRAEGGWSLLLVGLPALFYATGFIVISAAEERIGLVATDPGAFKAHYLQVGFACSSFIAMLASVGFVQRHLVNREPLTDAQIDAAGKRVGYKPGLFLKMFGRDDALNVARLHSFIRFIVGYPLVRDAGDGVRFQGGFIFITLPVLAGLYLRLTISTPDTFQGWPLWALLGFCAGTIILGTLSQYFQKRYRRYVQSTAVSDEKAALNRKNHSEISYPGYLKCIPTMMFILGCDYLLAEASTIDRGHWDSFHQWCAVLFVVVFIALLLGRIAHLLLEEIIAGPQRKDRTAWITLSGMLVCFLYYTLAYAYSGIWHPYVALRKGGADFTNAQTTVLKYSSETGKLLPPEFKQTDTESKKVIILLETNDLLYVALDSPARATWGKVGGKRPSVVYRLAKASIAGAISTDSNPGATPQPSVGAKQPDPTPGTHPGS